MTMINWTNWMDCPRKLFLFFLIAGGVAFYNGLNHPFMIDDHVFFDEMGRNPRNLLLNLIPDKAKVLNLEGPSTEVYYRPLALLVPRIIFLIFGGNVFFMHLANLLLFVTAAWLWARLLGRWSGDMLFATLTAVFLLVHPLNGIIVNFKTAGIFALQLIFMAFVSDWMVRQKPIRPWASIAFLLGAFFCHESTFVLPPSLTVARVLYRKESWKQAVMNLLPLWIAGGLYFFLRMHWASLGTNLFDKFSAYHMTMWQFAASWFSLQAWYMSKFFVPQGIVIWALRPVVYQNPMDWLVPGFAIWFMVVWTIRRFLCDQVWMWVGLSWLAIGLVMMAVGSLFQGDQLMIEPHWLVFPSIGFFMMLANLIVLGMRSRLKFFVLAAVALLLFVWLKWDWWYNALWNKEIGYCYHWMQENPTFKPVNMYIARAYVQEGKLDLAAKHYEMALMNQYPDYLMYTNLGSIALIKGDLDKAEVYLKKSLVIEPRGRGALNSLGIVFIKKKDFKKAEECFQRAIAANRFDSTALKNLRMLENYKATHRENASTTAPLRLE